ncbi:hypothetical protein C8Q78DRAFT_1026508 [Trametes maxima]|nr:hypothetical protein C8Q78DRAFT_1026508 [Trametes maxima]
MGVCRALEDCTPKMESRRSYDLTLEGERGFAHSDRFHATVHTVAARIPPRKTFIANTHT